MGIRMKLARKFNRFEPQKFRIAVLAGCFLATMAFIVLLKPRAVPSSTLSVSLPSNAASTSVSVEDTINSQQSESRSEMEAKSQDDMLLPKSSVPTIVDSTQKENKTNSVQSEDARSSTMNPESKSLCDVSSPRSDICEMKGDIRIHGSNSTVTFVTTSSSQTSNNSWVIRPISRKRDQNAITHVRQVFVNSKPEAPSCTHNHSVPAVVFSVSGYTGNVFHDFTDVLVPLFLTARQFDGEVQFLVSDMNAWWIYKYRAVLHNLSRHPIIDFDKDDGVHCFTKAIVGLRFHKDLSIDPSRAPNRYSMLDFTRFMRNSYSLKRESPSRAGKPRLLIIPRNRTRALLNVDEIKHLAEELGYQVLVAEPAMGTDVARFADVVNSCDVMVGVHGAGLTNMVFLPPNATLIQVVPWGGLERLAMYTFGEPARGMELQYLQYSISEEESSLIEEYPRDHPVFKDPSSFHKRGWDAVCAAFMTKQNVRLDVTRFRPVLFKALELLHSQKS